MSSEVGAIAEPAAGRTGMTTQSSLGYLSAYLYDVGSQNINETQNFFEIIS
jgi:hypothetical protein